MSTPLSLYTTKILGEHPLAVWALDDQADYVSILDPMDRDISLWSSSVESVAVEESLTQESPIVGEKVYSITDTPTVPDETIKFRLSGDIIGSFVDLDDSLATFSLSSFIKIMQGYIVSASIGISYTDESFGSYDVSKKFLRFVNNKWIMISETFDIPQGLDEDYSLFIEVEYLSSQSLDPFIMLVSGYSIGQWSEEFSSTSMGVKPEFLSDSIYGIPSNTKAIRVLGSVESTKDGYILANDSRLYARNFGMPLVYGSESSTTIYPNTDLPSILIPGLGFLNKSGQNKNYSLEFWMRVNSFTSSEKRIFGPVASTDGLYMDGPFIKIKIGQRVASHFVGEWSRPMAVHFIISDQQVSLLINGESVAVIDVDRSTLSFPEENIGGSQADWLGFYSYEETTPFEINSISIYSYLISNTIAKRRWIYGQAVDNPEALNTAFGGKSIYFDYEFSKYGNGYSYPKTGSWADGTNNNMEISGNRLGIPKYSTPAILSETSTQLEILEDNLALQNEDSLFISLPTDSSFYFDTLNPLNSKLEAIFGVFKIKSNDFENETLLLIKDDISGNHFEVFITPGTIWYSLKIYNQTITVASSEYSVINEKFAVGLAFDKMAMYFGNELSNFLSNRDSLKLFVGGGPDRQTFSGNIYDISFLNEFSFNKSSSHFADNGLLAELDSDIINNAYTSYSMKITEDQNTLNLDVSSYGSWTTSLPMSYFGKYIINDRGNSSYDLDFIQFNVGYPSPGSFVRVTETDESWTYQELNLKFSSPTQKRYSDLDNSLYTGYVDYTDLQYNARQTYRYDTSSSLVKTYIYFKDISSGMGNSENYYSEIISPAKNGIVSPGSEWINTKYEIVDDMIIYPPTGIDFSKTAIFVEIISNVDGISDKPVSIDKLQLASVSLNNSYGTPIGTKFGIDVYPFTKNGFYYDFKAKNPFSLYKGSSPYLYLNKNSGIRVRGDFSAYGSRGIEIPVNSEKSPKYKMIALQFFAKFEDDFFPYSPTEILEIESSSGNIKLFMEAVHPQGKRAKLYAVNVKTGQVENGVGFYVNGKLVKDGIMTIKQWSAIGIGLANFIDFSVTGGAIRITGPLTITNLSHYNSVNLQQVQTTSARQWLKVKEDGFLTLDWEYWEGQFKWFEVLVLASSSFYGVDPSGIYKTYTGTSRVGIDDQTILRAGRYKYNVLSGAKTDLFTIN